MAVLAALLHPACGTRTLPGHAPDAQQRCAAPVMTQHDSFDVRQTVAFKVHTPVEEKGSCWSPQAPGQTGLGPAGTATAAGRTAPPRAPDLLLAPAQQPALCQHAPTSSGRLACHAMRLCRVSWPLSSTAAVHAGGCCSCGSCRQVLVTEGPGWAWQGLEDFRPRGGGAA